MIARSAKGPACPRASGRESGTDRRRAPGRASAPDCRRAPGRASVVVTLLTGLALVAVGCGGPATATASGGATSSLLAPLEETPATAASPDASPAPRPGSTSPSPEAHAALVRIDPSLLDILPSELDGNQLTESSDAETSTASDPAVSKVVGRLAVAFVADPTASNWAVATVSALRPGFWSDSFFRDWRDTYDAGACAQSGGVSGNAETDMGARHVWIDTCANGLHTYHTHLAAEDLLVSVSALGDARYGEQLITALDVGNATVGAVGGSPTPSP